MRFKNRQHAGQLLAPTLKAYRHEHCIVYAIPRGGVPIGAELARYLNAPLDLIIPRKVGHPYMPEYAIAAVTEQGAIVYNDEVIDTINSDWLNTAIETQRAEAVRRRRVYLKGRRSLSPKNHIAILTDDGLATGLTIRAAITELASMQPDQIIVAVPVGPADVIARLTEDADEIVALINDQDFQGGVGAYYDDFEQTSDEQVIKLLKEAAVRNQRFNEPKIE